MTITSECYIENRSSIWTINWGKVRPIRFILVGKNIIKSYTMDVSVANRGNGATMKRILILLPVLILVLALGLVGCSYGDQKGYEEGYKAGSKGQTKVDTPVFRNDEACALVYNYLGNKFTSMTDIIQRIPSLGILDEARPYFSAKYQGNGKWVVSALGSSEGKWSSNGGLWNLYEASRTIEPANDQATELIRYIQHWTMTKIEGKETTPTPTIIVPSAPAVPPAGLQAIESYIDGVFQGWDGETIFRLMNGQIWQQAEYSYLYHYAYMPRVTIFSVSGGYKMQVEGVNKAIRVQRLR